MLSGLEDELEKIRIKINGVEATTIAKQKEKRRIETEVGRLKNKINKVKKDPRLSSNIQEKRREIDALKSEIDKLLEIADLL